MVTRLKFTSLLSRQTQGIKNEKKRREVANEIAFIQKRANIKKKRKAKRLQNNLYRNPYARENSTEKDIGDQ